MISLGCVHIIKQKKAKRKERKKKKGKGGASGGISHNGSKLETLVSPLDALGHLYVVPGDDLRDDGLDEDGGEEAAGARVSPEAKGQHGGPDADKLVPSGTTTTTATARGGTPLARLGEAKGEEGFGVREHLRIAREVQRRGGEARAGGYEGAVGEAEGRGGAAVEGYGAGDLHAGGLLDEGVEFLEVLQCAEGDLPVVLW